MADNSSDAYKKALKQIEDMINKQKALKKSTDSLRDAWSSVSSEIFKIDGAHFFEEVRKSPAEVEKIAKQIGALHGQVNILGDAVGSALDVDKTAQKLKKSILGVFDNLNEESSRLKNALNSQMDILKNQGGELFKHIKNEEQMLKMLKDKNSLNKDQKKFLEEREEFLKLEKEYNEIDKKHQKAMLGIFGEHLDSAESLAGFDSEALQSIAKKVQLGKSWAEIAKEGSDSELVILGIIGKQNKEIAAQIEGMRDAAEQAEKLAKSADETVRRFQPLKGLMEGVKKQIMGGIVGSIKKFDDVLHDVQKNTGIIMDDLGNASAFGDLTIKAAQFGVSVEQAGEMMTNLSKELNTTDFGVLAKASEDFLAIEGATGAASSDITTIAGEMMRMGASSEQVKETFQDTTNIAKQFGVSSKKVFDSMAKNITRFKNMGFQGGEKSLARLAAKAEQMRMSIDSAFDMSEKARSIEGALDMAAELQLAGGSFSNINPMDLLAAARKGPEEMQKILSKMGSDIGKFNEDGTFDIDAVDSDRLRMVAEATGVKFEDLRNGIQKTAEDAKKFAKIGVMDNMLDGLNEADKEMAKSSISQMMKIGEGGKIEFVASSDMAKRMGIESLEELQTLNSTDLKKKMEEDKKTLEEENERNQSLAKSWDNFINGLMALGSILQPVLEGLTRFIQGMTSIFQEVASWGDGFGKYLLGGLMAAFLLFGTSVGTFVAQGIGGFAKSVMSFGKAILNPKGAISGMIDKVKNKFKESIPGSDIAGDKNMTPAAGQAKKGFLMGLADGIKQFGKKVEMTDLLKFAASMAIIGTAIIGFGYAMTQIGGEAGIAQMVTAAVSLGLLMGSIWILSKIAGKVDMDDILKGALAMVLVGASLVPFAFAAQMLTGVDWMSVLAGIGILALVVLGLMELGALMMMGPILFLSVGVDILIAVGAGLAIAAAGLLLSATAFQQLGAIDWNAFSGMGAALMAVVPGMLGFSLAAMAFANPISLIGLMFMAMALSGLVLIMAPLAASLSLGADSLDRFAAGLEKLSAAADKLSLEKLEKLKELSDSMATASAGGAIAAAMANMANAASGGGGGNESNEPRKLEIAIKLNGRDIQAQVVRDSAIIK